MAQNRLDGLVIISLRVEVGGQAGAEGVPAVPVGQRLISVEYVSLGFVLLFGLPADCAARAPAALGPEDPYHVHRFGWYLGRRWF